MRLVGGPAHGQQVQTTGDPWVWVDVDPKQGLLVVDTTRPEDEQFPNRHLGGWEEYDEDPFDPSIYRWTRRLPVRGR